MNISHDDISIFVNAIRHAQKESGKPLRGATFLRSGKLAAIQIAAQELVGTLSDKSITEEHASYMMQRFEEMCRRQKHSFDERWRQDILKLLSSELMINYYALNLPIQKLIPVTIYHGGIAPQLLHEFPAFKNSPGIFNYAVYKHPTEPRKFLQEVSTQIDKLKKDPEFIEFLNYDWVFRYAATNSPRDASGFLRGIQRSMEEIATKPEFTELAQNKPLIMQTIIGHPNEPEKFLQKFLRAETQKSKGPT